MRDDKKINWSGISRQMDRGEIKQAVENALFLLDKKVSLPRDIDAFFPPDDGRQDLLHTQDFGLTPFRATYSRAYQALRRLNAASLPESKREILLAYTAIFEGEYSAALKHSSRASSLTPDNFWAHFFNAMAWWLLGDLRRTRLLLPDADDSINRAIAIKPGYKYNYVIRGGLRREMEDVGGRMADANRVMAMDPNFIWARTERIEILGENGEYREGLKEADRLVRQYPNQSWSWAQRSRLHGFCGAYQRALEDLNRALELEPGCGSIWGWRGEVFRRLGRYQEAQADLKKAVRLDPEYTPTNGWIGRINLMLGRYSLALRSFKIALKQDSREVMSQAGMGQALWEMGRCREAFECFMSLYPAEPRTMWNTTHVKEKETQEAYLMLGKKKKKPHKIRWVAYWLDLDRIVARKPKDAWAWVFRGRSKATVGRIPEAIADLSRAIELDQNLGWAYAWRGETLRRQGAFDRSLSDFGRALKLLGRQKWVLAWKGRALHQMNRLSEALDFLAEAVDGNQEQNFSIAHVWKGECLWRLNRRQEAVREFRLAFKLDARCEEAKLWGQKLFPEMLEPFSVRGVN